MILYNGFMILNVYKPKTWTSNDVVKKLKNVLDEDKIGHAGTLDPLAEGVLVVLTGEDTKKQPEIMSMKKEYVADIGFGATTDSLDLETALEYSDKKILKDNLYKKLMDILPNYVGKIDQKVPMYSAASVGGERLYKKARRGEMLPYEQLPSREVVVDEILLLEVNYNKALKLPVATFVITCGSGFYVRSLARDLGRDLGVGGVLVNLIRTEVGDYSVSDSKPISSF